MRWNKKTDHPEAGFSLVELAIALVVVGILVAGVLKGQDLIESARLKRVVSQIQNYQLATSTFFDRYDALPGDFAGASRIIDPRLVDGDGTGTLAGAGLQPETKAFHFWSHLSLAGLITPPGKSKTWTNPNLVRALPQRRWGVV